MEVLKIVLFCQRLKCDNQINQVFFILTKREISMNRKYLLAPTLAGPPLLHLNNLLFMLFKSTNIHTKTPFQILIAVLSIFLKATMNKQGRVGVPKPEDRTKEY